jgi:hypothetical protein
MSQKVLNQIRDAVLAGQYALSEHAYDEMDEGSLDVLDVEAAILSGRIEFCPSGEVVGDYRIRNEVVFKSCTTSPANTVTARSGRGASSGKRCVTKGVL